MPEKTGNGSAWSIQFVTDDVTSSSFFLLQDGMGQLRIVPGGLQLRGQAMVFDALIASSIQSRKGQPITIESSRNFTVTTRDEIGKVASRMVLSKCRKPFY